MILGGHDTKGKAKTAYDVVEGRVTLVRLRRGADETEAPLHTTRSYAVQSKRTMAAACRVTVDKIRRSTVGELTFPEARAAGHPNVELAQAAWQDAHELETLDPDQGVWVIEFTIDRQNRPLYLAAYSPLAYTTDPRRALRSESDAGVLLEAVTEDDVASMTRVARERMPVGEPKAKPPAEPGLVDRVEEALRVELAERFRGESPDDIAALAPHQGTPGDIRSRRRAMGRRAIDGLYPVPDDQVDELVRSMANEGCSVRDVALALDCSVGKAQKLLSPYRRSEAA